MRSILEEMRETADTGGKILQTSPKSPETSRPQSMLEPDYAEPYAAWQKNPGPQTASGLLKAVEPVIQAGLRTYGGSSADSPLLRSRAKIRALDAIKRYDPARAGLRTHLLTNLQSLNRDRAAEESIIAVPERMRLARTKLQQASDLLSDRIGREPSDMELQQHTGIPISHIEKIRKSGRVVAESQIETAADEDETFSPAVVDRSSDKTWLRFVYGDLDPYDKVILERTAGLHGKEIRPKKEIAAMLGISPSAVSQRLERIQRLLDTRETVGNLI
jgi:DNA-directed RNA polymerase specialized sigma subunit